VRKPEQVAAERRNGVQTYLRWFELKTCLDAVRGHSSAMWQGRHLWAHPSFISSGPIIEDFTVVNFGTSDLAIPGNDRHRIHVFVTSPVELAEVRIYDGEELMRRFVVKGKSFERTFDNFHDRQHNYIVTATDKQGGRAVSWFRGTSVQEYSFTRCSDNFNTMCLGKWCASRIKPLRGIEDYIRQTSLGFLPMIVVEQPDGSAGRPEDTIRFAVRQRIVQSGRFGSVVDHELRSCYPLTASANWNKAVIEPTRPIETFEGVVRVTRFCPRADGVLVHLIEGNLRIKKDLKLRQRSSVPFSAAVMHGVGFDNFCIMEQNGNVRRRSLVPEEGRDSYYEWGDIGKRRYAGAYPAMGGSVAVVPLSGPFRYFVRRMSGKQDEAAGYFAAGLFEDGVTLKAGQTVQYRLLTVHSKRCPEPDDGFISDLYDKLGLDGTPGYGVSCARGEVVDTAFALRLRAAGGGVCARISEAKLPLDLPAYVEGLNPRWHAGIWYKGEQTLVIPEWTLDATFDRYVVRRPRKFTDAVVRFPVSKDGVGMLQIDTEIGDKEVYIGNLLVCDRPEVWLSLEDDRPGRQKFVAHNPTDSEITCKVRPGPGFDLLPKFERTITLAPGSSLDVEIGARE